jgi:hypothetical protein
MLDNNITLVSDRLDKNLIADTDCDRLVRKGLKKFWLYNSFHDHYLEITENRHGVIIYGSWRKWYFGKDSFNDLSPYEIVRVCIEICRMTGLSFDAILDAKFQRGEFGFTFLVSVLPSTILNSMFRYSTFDLGRYDTSISFRGSDRWLSAYDKTEEINKARRKKGEPPLIDSHYYLRIEFKAFRATAFYDKLRGIRTIRDLLKNYRMLCIALLNEIKKIEMTPINLTIDNVNLREMNASKYKGYLIFSGMDAKGARKVFKDIEQLNATKKSKTDFRNLLRDLNAFYDKQSLYKRSDFIDGEIKKQIAKMISQPAWAL